MQTAIFDCELTTTQVQRLAGVACYRTLDHWVRTGLLPVTKPAQGTGRRRGWSFADLIRARTVAKLRAGGASLQAIRKAVALVTERLGETDPLTAGRLVVAGEKVFWALDDGALLEVLSGQLAIAVLVLDVGSMARELLPEVVKLCAVA